MDDKRLPLKTRREARLRAGVIVAERKPFSNSSGTFRGIPGRADTIGALPDRYLKMWSSGRIVYTIMSYETPIAWLNHTGVWIMPDVSYSQTTSVQQGITRTYLLVGEPVAA